MGIPEIARGNEMSANCEKLALLPSCTARGIAASITCLEVLQNDGMVCKQEGMACSSWLRRIASKSEAACSFIRVKNTGQEQV